MHITLIPVNSTTLNLVHTNALLLPIAVYLLLKLVDDLQTLKEIFNILGNFSFPAKFYLQETKRCPE